MQYTRSILRTTPEILKHVGRGARLAKALDEAEAQEIMGRIVRGEVDPVQVGGFLMAMRMKGETAEELAGFVRALREEIHLPPAAEGTVDVDVHGDGREGRPSVSIAAARIAVACGARVVLRGWFANPRARHDLGAAPADVPFMDLADYAPRVAALLALRSLLGVRTCVNSAVKLLDPLQTRRALIGIFHTPYHGPVGGAAARLGFARAAVIQAPGGLPEPPPDKPTKITFISDGVATPEPTVYRAPAAAALGQAMLMLWAAGLAPSPADPAWLGRAIAYVEAS